MNLPFGKSLSSVGSVVRPTHKGWSSCGIWDIMKDHTRGFEIKDEDTGFIFPKISQNNQIPWCLIIRLCCATSPDFSCPGMKAMLDTGPATANALPPSWLAAVNVWPPKGLVFVIDMQTPINSNYSNQKVWLDDTKTMPFCLTLVSCHVSVQDSVSDTLRQKDQMVIILFRCQVSSFVAAGAQHLPSLVCHQLVEV